MSSSAANPKVLALFQSAGNVVNHSAVPEKVDPAYERDIDVRASAVDREALLLDRSPRQPSASSAAGAVGAASSPNAATPGSTATKRKRKIQYADFSDNDNLPRLKSMIKKQKWTKSKDGTDRDNLNILLNIYKRWGNEIASNLDFDDFLRKTHVLGRNSLMQVKLEEHVNGQIRFRRKKGDDKDADDDNNNDDDDDKNNKTEPVGEVKSAAQLWDELDQRREAPIVAQHTPPPRPAIIQEQMLIVPLTVEQRERAERNRLAALEKRKARLAALAAENAESNRTVTATTTTTTTTNKT